MNLEELKELVPYEKDTSYICVYKDNDKYTDYDLVVDVDGVITLSYPHIDDINIDKIVKIYKKSLIWDKKSDIEKDNKEIDLGELFNGVANGMSIPIEDLNLDASNLKLNIPVDIGMFSNGSNPKAQAIISNLLYGNESNDATKQTYKSSDDNETLVKEPKETEYGDLYDLVHPVSIIYNAEGSLKKQLVDKDFVNINTETATPLELYLNGHSKGVRESQKAFMPDAFIAFWDITYRKRLLDEGITKITVEKTKVMDLVYASVKSEGYSFIDALKAWKPERKDLKEYSKSQDSCYI